MMKTLLKLILKKIGKQKLLFLGQPSLVNSTVGDQVSAVSLSIESWNLNLQVWFITPPEQVKPTFHLCSLKAEKTAHVFLWHDQRWVDLVHVDARTSTLCSLCSARTISRASWSKLVTETSCSPPRSHTHWIKERGLRRKIFQRLQVLCSVECLSIWLKTDSDTVRNGSQEARKLAFLWSEGRGWCSPPETRNKRQTELNGRILFHHCQTKINSLLCFMSCWNWWIYLCQETIYMHAVTLFSCWPTESSVMGRNMSSEGLKNSEGVCVGTPHLCSKHTRDGKWGKPLCRFLNISSGCEHGQRPKSQRYLGPIHTGCRAPCNRCTQIMEHIVVNGSVHTALQATSMDLHANLLANYASVSCVNWALGCWTHLELFWQKTHAGCYFAVILLAGDYLPLTFEQIFSFRFEQKTDICALRFALRAKATGTASKPSQNFTWSSLKTEHRQHRNVNHTYHK